MENDKAGFITVLPASVIAVFILNRWKEKTG